MRRTKATPLYLTATARYRYDDAAVNAGNQLLHLEPTPQQLVISRVLEARKRGGLRRELVPARSRVVIQAPRRSSKTTSIWATLVGRCETIPGYQVITTAQSGKRARARLMKVADVLERHPHIKVGRGVGNEHITWTETGSRIEMFPPVPGAFRGEGKHAVLMDEGQEIDDDADAEALIQAIMPLFDTEPLAQLIVAGTAGEHREGLLWSRLVLGREGRDGWGIVDYAAPDGADLADEKVWLATHPGIGTLTTLGIIRERWSDLKGAEDPTKFGREYLGVWPSAEQVRVISAQAWEACYLGETTRPPRPAPGACVLAYDVAPDDSAGAIVCVWRDDDGRAHLKVMEHSRGHTWMPNVLARLAVKLRAPIAYDSIGPNIAVAEALGRARPRPKLAPANVRQMQARCSQMLAEIVDRTIRHEGETPLDDAVEGAAKRIVGDGWVWGRRTSSTDVTPLIAATAGLGAVDDIPPETRPVIRTRRRAAAVS